MKFEKKIRIVEKKYESPKKHMGYRNKTYESPKDMDHRKKHMNLQKDIWITEKTYESKNKTYEFQKKTYIFPSEAMLIAAWSAAAP